MAAAACSLRASLLSDAKKITFLRRWSIRQLLLDFNSGDTMLLTSTLTSTTTTPSTNNYITTKALLHEMQIRLASQHSKLVSFSSSFEKYAKIFNSEERGGVNIVHRNLSNLQVLHENTYLLLQNFTEGSRHDDDSPPLLLDSKITAAEAPTNELATSLQQQRNISNTFDEIMSRHGNSVETLADSVLFVRDSILKVPSILRQPFLRDVKLLHDNELEQYLHSRLMIQLLCEHYVSLHNMKIKQKKKKSNGGAITLNGDIFDLIDDASTEARHVCDANLGVAPEVIVRKSDNEEEDEVGFNTIDPPPFIRSWLHHALVEVFKNAMTSNVQMMHSGMKRSLKNAKGESELSMLPPSVHVFVSMKDIPSDRSSNGGGNDGGCASMTNNSKQQYLVIQVRDQGIGVRDIDEAFRFARSSSQKRWDRLNEQQSYAAVRQPLGSLGVGLTLSRLMLRAFGGDLTLSNNDQHQFHHHRRKHKEGTMNGAPRSGCTATLMINCDDSYMAEN